MSSRRFAFGVLFALAGLAAPLASPGTAAAQTAPARSPRNANYEIAVQLEPATHTLRGSERIEWRNITKRPTSELQFHLYWNAWADTKSTWMRESARSRSITRPGGDYSRLTLESLRLESAAAGAAPTDLLPSLHYLAPDDGNADDRTVMSVALPKAVRPGETLVIEVAWTARVPRTFDRTGVIGNYYFIGQWFPKLGVLEDSGWNTHQFHSMTEFFSDYGVYDVQITTPKGWVVGATGTDRGHEDSGSRTTWHYVQEDVHDFAWTTSPDFVERTARFEEPGLPPVDLRLLIQPEHLGQAERHFAATRSTLRRYGTWFGPYPYGHLTIVDPAFQSETGGMEYPTLFTVGTSWLVSKAVTLSTPEETAVHEAGHQFWYGLVGNNEFEHGWMDEGINSFATARAMAADFPDTFVDRRYFGGFIPWTFRDIRYPLNSNPGELADYRLGATEDALATPTFRMRPDTVRYFAYDKPAIWLNTLERWLGWPVLQEAMRRTFVAGTFAHPTPETFLAHLENAAAREDVAPFIAQTYQGSAVFDYSVDDLDSRAANDQFESRVIVRRLGDGIFPVDLQVTFDDGHKETRGWDGSARWAEFAFTGTSAVQSAVVDPEWKLLLDTNRTNNSRTTEPQAAAAARKWSLKFMVWLQDALLTWGLFA